MTSNNNNPQKEPENQQEVTPSSTESSSPSYSAATTSAAKKEPTNNTSGRRLGIIAIAISIVIGGSLFAYTQYQQHQYQNRIDHLQAKLFETQQTLKAQLDKGQQSLDDTENLLKIKTDTALKQQQKSIESLQMAVADVKGRRPNDWLLAEADYLVKMAGRKLYLEHDPETATQLMESADQRIASLNDPSLVNLRQAMADDITTLHGIPLIDKDGLVLRLNSLEQKIDQLPLANAILPDAQEEKHDVVSENINDWQHNLLTSLKDFAGNFITFRSRDGNVVPLLSPKQDFYLRENLKAKLETAIRAVYDRQQEVFTNSLETANTWTQSFFNSDNKQVQNFRATVAELAKQKVTVKYPTTLSSQAQLSDIIRERLRREVTSMTGEDKQ
ncbi:uroporphyrinogen-III C-methyltransferase [Vibrio nitrifigilis]|uniref:Uroporphyrinogen-III C-methyltransferase n=1 Tax=Vibrio nitrifigilis TaxID=2789781 RepID=A0ABS0GHP5_9VIBR|nr:uroporphyrinogen-III C-methyltransferase [Vibrio nitrifigilis]MBF9001963.1 uroporphyrinogen-III C-methyltransferase [Vibrio nitrifigilis]